MSNLKIKVKIIHGQGGMPMNEYLQVSQNILSFLDVYTKNKNIQIEDTSWLIDRFHSSDPEYLIQCDLPTEERDVLTEGLEEILTINIEAVDFSKYNLDVLKSFFKISDPLQFREKVNLGLITNGTIDEPAKWHSLKKQDSIHAQEKIHKAEEELKKFSETETEYFGEVEGVIHAWYKEDEKPHISVRNHKSNKLVRCYYDNSFYNQIITLFENKDVHVCVFGLIKYDNIKDEIDSIFMEKIAVDPYPDVYKEGDFDKIFGCAKGITEGLSPREYIEKNRS